MNLSTIHHIAIIVSDYTKSKEFYVDKLGFEIIRETIDHKKKTGNLILGLIQSLN